MAHRPFTTKSRSYTRAMLLAGIAGGLAEVAWIGVYCWATALSGADVLAAIARVAGAGALPAPSQPVAGLLVHFALAIVLALAFGSALKAAVVRGLNVRAIVPLSLGALLAVWVLGFGVVLPRFAPELVALAPAAVFAVSNLLFGAAMGVSLHGFISRPLRLLPVARRIA